MPHRLLYRRAELARRRPPAPGSGPAVKPPLSSKERLARGEKLLGAIVRMPNEALVELAGLQGFDFVVIDTEHGPGDQVQLLRHLTAAQAYGLDVVVRVGDPAEALRVLDLGASGIVVPHVSSVEDARAAVAAAHYPPLGRRGLATYTRAGRYGLADAPDHVAAAGRRTLVVLMIEDADGVAAVEDIASLQGVDGLFVGPADLAHAIGLTGQTGARAVVDAVARVHAAAHGAARAVMSIAADAASARAQLESGADMVLYNVQAALSGLFAELAGIRATTPSATAEPVVFLPGMLGDERLFEGVLSFLSGSVAPLFGRIDLDDSVSAMAESVLAAAPARFALVGHSLGAVVALEMTRQAPERVSRLALLNSNAGPPRPELLESWQSLRGRIEAGAFASSVPELAASNLPPGAARELLELSGKMARRVGAGGLLRQLKAQSTRPDQRKTLGDIRVPTLVLSGGLDTVCAPEYQYEQASAIPGARHVVLADTGHMSPIENPQGVAAALRQWLQAAE